VDPAPQPFALATEHELLKQRVAMLEAVILKTQGSGALRLVSSFDQDSAEVDELDSDQGGRDSDTEDAALVLEELGERFSRPPNPPPS